MGNEEEQGRPWLAGVPRAVLVRDETSGEAWPFLLGILVSSLIRRGVSFPDAYATARDVEARLTARELPSIDRRELADIVQSAVKELDAAAPVAADTDSNDILVIGSGTSMPFSKGILSQSLLAAAVDPRDAFEVARAIERELTASRIRQIDRHALRGVARDALERRAGVEAAQRYLVWRRYEEPEKPVILLLGGTSGVGKTTLALEVARRMGIGRVLSTDSIRQMMRLMISSELMPWIHASSYDAYQLLGQEFGRSPTVLDGFRSQAASVAVGVRASLDRSIEERANLVVDGVSLLPGVIDLERYASRAIVVFCVVATLDEAALRDRFAMRAAGQRQRLAHRYLENFEGILEIQRHLIEEANRRGMLVIDNTDVDRSAQEILAHVLDELRGDRIRG